jgi:hypothetical protein
MKAAARKKLFAPNSPNDPTQAYVPRWVAEGAEGLDQLGTGCPRSTGTLLFNIEVNLCGGAILGDLLAVQFHF